MAIYFNLQLRKKCRSHATCELMHVISWFNWSHQCRMWSWSESWEQEPFRNWFVFEIWKAVANVVAVEVTPKFICLHKTPTSMRVHHHVTPRQKREAIDSSESPITIYSKWWWMILKGPTWLSFPRSSGTRHLIFLHYPLRKDTIQNFSGLVL